MRWTRWTFEETGIPETLQAKSVKQGVLEMIQRLPDDCTLEQIEYHLHVYAGIQRAVAEIDVGENPGIPQEEAEQRIQEWLKSSGVNPH
jgi:hypothetical protein